MTSPSDLSKRQKWWLSSSPEIVIRIAAFLANERFGPMRWWPDQLGCEFLRPRAELVDRVSIGIQREGVFWTSFGTASARVAEIERQLDLVPLESPLREMQLAALDSGLRHLITANLRGFAPAADGGMTLKDTLVSTDHSQCDLARTEWVGLYQRFAPQIFDQFDNAAAVASFLAGDPPATLKRTLERDARAVFASSGSPEKYLEAAILFGLDQALDDAAVALKYFTAATQSSFTGSNLSDARRYAANVSRWLRSIR